MGGSSERDQLYIEPTILVDVTLQVNIMQDEIFGPILPILTVDTLDEAVDVINRRSAWGGKPLALYIFTEKQGVVDDVFRRTSAGGCTVNDVIMHMGCDTLPFGGVGYSGTGRYHGKFSFDTFTHEKAVLHRNMSGERALWVRYPPYDASKLWWAERLFVKRSLPAIPGLEFIIVALLGALLGAMAALKL